MKKILFSTFILLISLDALSCSSDPQINTARQYKWHLDNSELVFFGKIASFDDIKGFEQTVTFIIHKTYKGPEYQTVTIINKLHSSCSAMFINKGSNYYVFSNFSKKDGYYIIKKGASFFTQDIAEKFNLGSSISHNKKINKDNLLSGQKPAH